MLYLNQLGEPEVPGMVVRVVVGVGWSLVSGLAGAWLLISPWALGEQGGGDWTDVTKAQFWTGAGLVALAAICLLIVASQVMSAMRDAGSVPAASARGRAMARTATPNEMDGALVALANALVADLNRQQAGAPPAQYAPAPPPQYAPAPPAQYAPGAVPPGVPAAPPNGPPQAPAPQAPGPQAPPGVVEPWRSR
jgi:hypothetical protein